MHWTNNNTTIQLYHHSHDCFYRSPFGAVSTKTPMILRLTAPAHQPLTQVLLWLAADGEKGVAMPMELTEITDGRQVYMIQFQAAAQPGLWWYWFQVEQEGHRYFYGNNKRGLGGLGEVYHHQPNKYQITVYRADISTPHWFKEGIMYQIFVDRFYNGHEQGQVLNPKEGSLIHAHWHDQPIYIRDREQRVVRWDFFGGNLLGIIKKLPYLKELGVTVIYLNPIFEAPSNHKYDTADYNKIDTMFGDEETFITLCAVAEKMGIHIILDGVFSHTGSDSIYFNKEGNYPQLGAYQSPQSAYYSWYRFTNYPDEYESWWGIDTLPNVAELEPSYQDFIVNHEDSIVKKWLKLGAKGWRLDVADELPDKFIQLIRTAMKEIDPQSVLLGEVWEDASNKISYGERRAYLLGDELDSTMNYPFRENFIAYLLGKKNANEAQRAMMSLRENYPIHHFYTMMNLVGTHDTERIITVLGEGQPAGDLGEVELSKIKLSPQQRQLAVGRLKLLVLIQMTFPGIPSIYYGDEAGLEGYGDPLCRRPFPWGREDEELLSWYKKLAAIRSENSALTTGEWLPLYLSPVVYGYGRRITGGQDVFGQEKDDNGALILVNGSNEAATISIQVGQWFNSLEDALTHEPVKLDHGILTITLEPLSAKLFLEQDKANFSYVKRWD